MMANGGARIPAWQRLLERPRLLHRLATFGLLGAAIVAGINAFVRGAPDGVSPEVRNLTYIFDALVWIVVVLAAAAEAFVAGLGAMRARPDGRPHYQIVFWIGLVITAILLFAYSSILGVSPQQLGTIGRIVKAAIAGMLPLLVGVTLVAGFTLLWVRFVQPRLEAHLEAQIRAFEAQQGKGKGRKGTARR
jgi:bacteriorhodopsin